MVATTEKPTFSDVENQLKKPIAADLTEGVTVGQVYGEMDDWKVEAAGTIFFLNPINRCWLLFDTIHNDWRDTGRFAGELLKDSSENLEKGIMPVDPVSSDSHGKAILIKKNEGREGEKYSLPPQTLIGNARNCDLKLSVCPEGVYLALILEHLGGYSIFGLDENYRLTINDKSVEESGRLINDGDIIAVQNIAFKFSLPDSPLEAVPISASVFRCKNCGFEFDRNIKFCTECGSPEPQLVEQAADTGAQSCPHCNENIKPQQKFCTGCGEKISTPVLRHQNCRNCGAECTPDNKFCTSCGERLKNEPEGP